jgi:hypothetical protein
MLKKKKSKVRLKRPKKKIISKKKTLRRKRLFTHGILSQLREPRLHLRFQIIKEPKL